MPVLTKEDIPSDGLYKKKYKKLVIVGDGLAGKTSLLYAFANDKMSDNDLPKILDHVSPTKHVITNDGKKVCLSLYDTAAGGQGDYDGIRLLTYSDADVVLICFPVEYPVRFENVIEKWAVEVRTHCPGIPVILVGCKVDLRDDTPTRIWLDQFQGRGPLTPEEGKEMAKRIHALQYLECSAKRMKGVDEVFVAAAEASLKGRQKVRSRRSWRCTIA